MVHACDQDQDLCCGVGAVLSHAGSPSHTSRRLIFPPPPRKVVRIMDLELTEEEKLLQSHYDESRLIKVKVVSRVEPQRPLTWGSGPSQEETSSSTAAPPAEPAGPKRAKVVRIAPTSSSTAGDYIHIEFDRKHDIHTTEWSCANSAGPLVLKLQHVDPTVPETLRDTGDKKDTLVIWATMPVDSTWFSFHISPTPDFHEGDGASTVVYSFQSRIDQETESPSIFESSMKDGVWSKDIDRSAKDVVLERGKQFQLRLTFCPQGIAVFKDGRIMSEFTYKGSPVASKTDLYLVVPTLESTQGATASVVVHRAWWGHTLPQIPVPSTNRRRIAFVQSAPTNTSTQTELPRYSSDDTLVERALRIVGLPKDDTALRELERIFEHYQVDTMNGRKCLSVDVATGIGFVKLQNTANAQSAINYLNNTRIPSGETLMVMHARRKQLPSWFE